MSGMYSFPSFETKSSCLLVLALKSPTVMTFAFEEKWVISFSNSSNISGSKYFDF